MRGQERPLVKVQPQLQLHAKELRLGTRKRAEKTIVYWRCQYHGMITKKSSGIRVDQPELRVLQRVELEK